MRSLGQFPGSGRRAVRSCGKTGTRVTAVSWDGGAVWIAVCRGVAVLAQTW